MYVRNYMLPKDKLTILQLEDTLDKALNKLNDGDFLSLPVFDGDVFKGILMKQSIYRDYFQNQYKTKDAFLKDKKIQDLMIDEVKTISENEFIENASYLLHELRTPFLAVLDKENKFVGILTHKAIFNAFSEVFGLGKGYRIVIDLYDVPGQLAKLTEVIRKSNINIINLAVKDAKVLDVYKVVIRVDDCNIDQLIKKIEAKGFKVSEVKSK